MTTKHVKDLPPGNYECVASFRLIKKEEGEVLETNIVPIVSGYYGTFTYYSTFNRVKEESDG